MSFDHKKISVLDSLIEICDIHASRLHMAHVHVAPLSPFDAKIISNLQDEQISFIELLISRFTKLQDVLGAKLFPLLLDFLQAEGRPQGFLDVLHQMEKLDLLESSKQWIAMRELRNHLTHEYPDNPDLVADNLNKSIKSSSELLEYWSLLKKKIEVIKKQWNLELQ